MGHVTVLAKPIVAVGLGIEQVAVVVKDPACGFLFPCLPVHHFLCYELVAVLVVRLPLIVDEEVDAGGKEVHG